VSLPTPARGRHDIAKKLKKDNCIFLIRPKQTCPLQVLHQHIQLLHYHLWPIFQHSLQLLSGYNASSGPALKLTTPKCIVAVVCTGRPSPSCMLLPIQSLSLWINQGACTRHGVHVHHAVSIGTKACKYHDP
jgi:hypothetical protein